MHKGCGKSLLSAEGGGELSGMDELVGPHRYGAGGTRRKVTSRGIK